MPTSRTEFLSDVMATFGSNPAYCAAWGADTDLTIASNPVHPSWGAGDKRVDYAAALKVSEPEQAVYFWEAVKRRVDDGSAPHDSVLPVVGPGSTSWEWGYGTLLALIQDVAARHGFTVKVVLSRSAASW